MRGDGSCFLGDGCGGSLDAAAADFFPFFASSKPSAAPGRCGVPGSESRPAGDDPADAASGLGGGMFFFAGPGESWAPKEDAFWCLGGETLVGVTASSESVSLDPGAETISESSAEEDSNSASFAARSAASLSASILACSAALAAASAALTAAAAAAACLLAQPAREPPPRR